jgi:hypothetical protein
MNAPALIPRHIFILLLVLLGLCGVRGSSIPEHDPKHATGPQDILESDTTTSSSRFSGPLQDDPPECNDKRSTKYDPLACWLWNMKIVIPDQAFQKSLFTVKVQALSCSNFVVQTLNSTFVPSDRQDQTINITSPSIDITVYGIAATCTGTYLAYPGGLSGGLQIIAAATQDNNPTQRALQLKWEVASSYNNTIPTTKQYWIPKALTTQQCQASLQVKSLHFSGSMSSKLIQMFAGVIGDAVSTQLNEQLCPILKDSVDPLVTQSIQSVVQSLLKYLSTNTTTTTTNSKSSMTTLGSYPTRAIELFVRPNQYQHRILSSSSPWLQSATSVDFAKDTPILVNILENVNQFLACFYETNTINTTTATRIKEASNCADLITKGMKGLASLLLNSLAKQVKLPIPSAMHSITILLPQYGKVIVDVQQLSVMGMDQLQSVTLLSPIFKDDQTISQFHNQLQAGNNGFNVTATMNITVFPIPGGLIHGDPLNEVFHVDFNMSKADALGIANLLLDKGGFQVIHIGRILDAFVGIIHPGSGTDNSTEDLRCLLATVQTLQVDDLDLQAIMESATFVPHFDESNFGRGRTRRPLVSRKLEEDLDAVLNNFLMLLLREYQPLLSDAVAGLVRTTLRTRLNEWVDQKLHNSTTNDNATSWMPAIGAADNANYNDASHCRSNNDGSDKQNLANFSTIPYLEKLNNFINEPTSLDSMNDAIERLAEEMEARYNPHSVAESFITWFPQLSKGSRGISLRLKALQIESFGSVDHIGKSSLYDTLVNPTRVVESLAEGGAWRN